MAGNSEKIDEIIDPVALKQVEDLDKALDVLTGKFVEATKAAIALNNATGGSNTIAAFKKNADESTKATKVVVDNATKAQAAQQKLSDAKTKSAAKDEAEMQKTLASMVKIQGQIDKNSRAYVELVKNRDLARDRARDIGATFGEKSPLFEEASKEANGFDQQIKGINDKLGDYTGNVGNYAEAAYGFIRKVAYALPGVGIGGIFALAINPILDLVKALQQGQTIVETGYEVTRKANDAYAEQTIAVKNLVDEVLNQNTAIERRGQLLEDLNKISPVYFGNLKNEADIIDKLPEAYKRYNDALLLTSKIQAIQGIQADKYKEILSLQQDIIENNDPTNPNRQGPLSELTGAFRDLFEFTKSDKIDNLQKTLKFLQGLTSSTQTDLTKAGGAPSGDDLERLQRISNNSIELNRIQLQSYIEMQDKISQNDAKSYNAREIALKNSYNAQLTLQQLTEAQSLNDIALTQDKREVIEKQGAADILKIQSDLASKQKDLTDKASAQNLANFTQDIETQKKTLKRIIDDTGANFDVRLDAIGDFYNKSAMLIDKNERAQVKAAGDNDLSIKNAIKKALNDRLDLDIQAGEDTDKILLQANNKLKQIYEVGIKDQTGALAQEIIDFKDAQDTKLIALEQYRSDAIKEQTNLYKNGEISAAQYNQNIYDLEAEVSKERIDLQLQTAQKIIDARKEDLKFGIGSAKDLQKAQDDLAKLQIQSSDLATKVELDNIKKLEQARQQLHQKEQELALASIALIQQIVDKGYQNQLDALKAQSDQITANSQLEKDAVDRSLLSSQQKADKEKLIDAQAAAQQQAISDKENDIKRKQAEFDKAASIARIIESTAVAVVQALTIPILGLALAGTIAALGAVQLATVIATPIPKYKMGTDSAKGGLSIVGDGGTELLQYPNGKSFLSPSTDTLMDLPTGTRVTPHNKLMSMLARPEKIQYVGGQAIDMGALSDIMADSTRQTVKAIKSQPKPVINGWLNEVRNSQAWQAYSNNHFR